MAPPRFDGSRPVIETIPLTDFQHDDIRARDGHPLWLEESLARDLERAGLLRIPTIPALVRGRRVAGIDPGKVLAAGVAAPSSASPAAPASPSTIAHSSEPGAIEPPRPARSSR
jgi:hypothetical protein